MFNQEVAANKFVLTSLHTINQSCRTVPDKLSAVIYTLS